MKFRRAGHNDSDDIGIVWELRNSDVWKFSVFYLKRALFSCQNGILYIKKNSVGIWENTFFYLDFAVYGITCSYKNYAVKCTKNRFADIVKKANAKGSVPANKIVPIQTVEDEQDPLNNVEDYVLEREYLKTFLQHISSTLNEEERSIFQMYIKGFSYKDIAQKVGISPKNVDNILQKIKRKLRQ